jgi:ankyrin repeat protein
MTDISDTQDIDGDSVLDAPIEPKVHEEIVTLDEEDERALRLDILHGAIRKNNVHDTEALLARNPELLECQADSQGLFPLHYAVKKGHIEIVKLLVGRGANVEILDTKRNFSPLIWAVRRGHKDIVEYLFECGVDLTVCDKHDMTSSIHWAAFSGRVDVLRVLLHRGANVETRDKYGFTPLHWACRRGRMEAAYFLVDQGADMEELTYDGATPLHCACFEGHKALSLSLMEHGADKDALNDEGFTPMQLWGERGGMWGMTGQADGPRSKPDVLLLHMDDQV